MSKNVMLLGRENELHIIQESSPCHSLSVKTDNGSIRNLGKCKFLYTPERAGMGQIVVRGPKGEYNYLVRVEEPVKTTEVWLGYIAAGKIQKYELLKQLGIIIKENGVVPTVPYKVQSYSMMIIRENKILKNFNFKGPRFTDDCIKELNNIIKHDHLVIYNIVVENPQGLMQVLQPAEFIIQ